MNGLALRERRLIAVALLLAVGVITWLGLVRPVIDGFLDRADRRAAALDDYVRNARIIRSYHRLRIQAIAHAAPALEITAASSAAASEAARSQLSGDLTACGAAVHAVREQQATPGAVRLRADFQIELSGLTALLRRIHDQAPSGVVDSLYIAADTMAAPGRPHPLEVHLDVSFAYATPLQG